MDTFLYTAYNVYIAQALSGDVLQIQRFTYNIICEGKGMQTDGIEIYKLDFDNQCIIGIDSLGMMLCSLDTATHVAFGQEITQSCSQVMFILQTTLNIVYLSKKTSIMMLEYLQQNIYNLEDDASLNVVSFNHS